MAQEKVDATQDKTDLTFAVWTMMYNALKYSFSREDAIKLQNMILPEVVKDVTETAKARHAGDETNFTSDDVRTAIGRILLRRFGATA
ncbi:hypothetical protein [Schwartzia sp. (in: firmicutes)]